MNKERKIGRPTDNPKNIQTRIRMTQEESDMLEECSLFFGITKTEVIIRGIKEVYSKIKK